ncbi:hypothetical protein D1AOALGA4SA_5367 [Olavius algarvensis Delta 1 endosymbiont]|nr:hypothetical protein D1AOALGA4SA_5367 [Olavius algarvensis Delta 1 endosymbiont]
MDCIDFKNRLIEIDTQDQSCVQEAQIHMAACASCQKLYRLDQLAEERFQESLAMIDPPADLYTRIKLDIPARPIKRKGFAGRWRRPAPALATAAIIFLVLFSYPPGGEIRDIDHIGSLALANHLDDQQAMVN